MKNPHGVEPTRYMNREDEYAIYCNSSCGPVFGEETWCDICISDKCNKKNSCFIQNNGRIGYECHSDYKKSLFVNTAEPHKTNYFSVFDYEVYGIDYQSKHTIDSICQCPDAVWEYIQTKSITEQTLQHVSSERELLNDLDVIHCQENEIRLKISTFFLKYPSKYLPDTHLVSEQYDEKLREWCGDIKWKLLFRASEHEYATKSFHKLCNQTKQPTLIVIKSSKGWIFGGYTTQSWKGRGIFLIYRNSQ